MRSDVRWNPREGLTPVERKIVKRLTRTGRLYAFLRENRGRLFDEPFQSRLAEAYADAAGGRPPVPPALLMMVTLLQAYGGISDAEAVHLALFDKRWQMVLDCMGCEEAPFSQGLLAESRFRIIRHDLDRELIRRTVELAKETGGFGYKALRVALDSAPIWGAGRVEDTFNLIGHGLMMCVACAADVWELESDDAVAAAKLQIVGKSSVKAALDIDWDDTEARARALDRLLADVTLFRKWLAEQPREVRPENKVAYDALDAAMTQLDRLVEQDVEPDPERSGGHRVIDGTAEDRQVSVVDPEMRHGRKSKSTTINGYKGHIAHDIDNELVLDGLAEPANKREHAAADVMRPNIEYFAPVSELHIDRGFLSAGWVTELDRAGIPVFSKPWNPTNHGLYPKSAFVINMQAETVACPGGEVVPFPSKRGSDGRRQINFTQCSTCPVRSKCTTSKRGRTIVLHEAEDFLQRLQAAKRTPEGRERLRDRVSVEHGLAHVLVYAPHKARYVGARKNTFALRRAGAIVNLQAAHRLAREAA